MPKYIDITFTYSPPSIKTFGIMALRTTINELLSRMTLDLPIFGILALSSFILSIICILLISEWSALTIN